MRGFSLVGSLTALIAGMAVAGAVSAQPRHGGPHPGGGPDRFIEEHAAQLGLDDQTRQAIDQIVDQSRVRARELHRELRGLHREMHDLLSQEAPNEAAVMQQAEAIGRAETELQKHRLGTLIKIRALLTDEQRAELTRIREETRAQWLQPLIEACGGDVEQLCPGAEDPWSRKRCLRHHRDELSPACRDAIEAARDEAPCGHRGPGPGGMGEF